MWVEDHTSQNVDEQNIGTVDTLTMLCKMCIIK